MVVAAKVFVVVSGLWAIAALTAQVLGASRGGRRDYSERKGSPASGVVYSFTLAMTPKHKESIRLYPIEFAMGLILHLGLVLALVGMLLLLTAPQAGVSLLATMRPLTVAGLFAGALLLARRFRTPNLREMSVADDYVAALATCGLLATALLPMGNPSWQTGFLIYCGALLIYLPLGKLRHACFFFVARGDYGRRLGYRGVYPPSSAGTE